MKASTDWERMYKESQKEVERLEANTNKAKAEAVRDLKQYEFKIIVGYGIDDIPVVRVSRIDDYADKLERGEV